MRAILRVFKYVTGAVQVKVKGVQKIDRKQLLLLFLLCVLKRKITRTIKWLNLHGKRESSMMFKRGVQSQV